MPAPLPALSRNAIIEAYFRSGSIKAVAKEVGISRNSVRRILREEHLTEAGRAAKREVAPSTSVPRLSTPCTDYRVSAIDFKFLQKMFELGREGTESLDFKSHILRRSSQPEPRGCAYRDDGRDRLIRA